jgi:hypothetical protein
MQYMYYKHDINILIVAGAGGPTSSSSSCFGFCLAFIWPSCQDMKRVEGHVPMIVVVVVVVVVKKMISQLLIM